MDQQIRPVKKSDLTGILDIALQLGYPASGKTVTDLIDLTLGSEEQQILIAEEGERLLGYIHLHYVVKDENWDQLEIAGILIPEANRNRGLGRTFLKRAEKLARSRNVHEIKIRTNLIRPEAIAFFRHHGFQLDPVQDAFIKSLV